MLFFFIHPTFSNYRISCDNFSRTSEEKGSESRRRLAGERSFFLVPPTSANLFAYEKWTCSANQDSTFFGDLVPNQCFYIDLCAGQTMMIPSVWIHSVYTPEDSLVFGGNFLHSYSIYRQLQAHSIEDRTRVNKIYRFFLFRQICFLCSDSFDECSVHIDKWVW